MLNDNENFLASGMSEEFQLHVDFSNTKKKRKNKLIWKCPTLIHKTIALIYNMCVRVLYEYSEQFAHHSKDKYLLRKS